MPRALNVALENNTYWMVAAMSIAMKEKSTTVQNADSVKTAAKRGPQRSVSLERPEIEELSEKNRKDILTLAGKEIASNLGSRILLGMLAETRMSMREVARKSGFDVSLLSNIAKGKRTSGPELWTLIALAEAMNLDLDLSFSKR